MSGTVSVEAPKDWHFVDKTDWGTGPWQHEPDKRQWTDEATGLVCLAVRNAWLGQWCGYVGMPDGHPLFGLDFDAVYDAVHIDVHGGLTFAAFCREDDKEHGICHVPEPGQPDRVWWLGWDCGHCYDFQPGLMARMGPGARMPGEVYRALEYVQQECKSLAAQLRELETESRSPDGQSPPVAADGAAED